MSLLSNQVTQRRHRRSSRRRTKRLQARLLIGFTFVLAAFAVLPFERDRLSPSSTQTVWLSHHADLDSLPPPQVEGGPANASENLSRRTVYAYSVIPGGVRDAQSLQAAVYRDPVVAAHYSDFNLDHARMIKLAAPRAAYVSYRMGDHVYWTRKKLTLAKGEEVITDGKHIARARCANRISDKIPGEISPAEPPPEILDQPSLEPPRYMDPTSLGTPFLTDIPLNGVFTIETPPNGAPSNPGGGLPFLPIVPPFAGPPPTNNNPGNPGTTGGLGTPVTPVPEPGSILLLATGLGALAAFRRKHSK